MISTKYKSSPYFLRDADKKLTLKRKAFANNIIQSSTGDITRHIASVSAYINCNGLFLEDMCLSSVNNNVVINVLEDDGWDHKCCTSKNFNTQNVFTKGKGIPTTKTIVKSHLLGVSSVSSSKTMSELLSQPSTNDLQTMDYLGNISVSNSSKSVNSTTGKKFMGENAFSNCIRLRSVRMSSDNSWNEFFSKGCFKSCSLLTTINTVTNSNSNMSNNTAVLLPVGTINATLGSSVINGSSSQFVSETLPGQMLYTESSSGTVKYIGTIKTIQNNLQITLVMPSLLTYVGKYRVTKEAMIPAHITKIAEESMRATNINIVTMESHKNTSFAASNSNLVSVGSNALSDCLQLTKFNFSVKQRLNGLAKTGTFVETIVPSTCSINVLSSDGWSINANKSQLSTLFNSTNINVVPVFLHSTNLNTSSSPLKVASIHGFVVHDELINFNNLIIPSTIMGTDETFYTVTEISYPFVDKIESISGQPTRYYGAFNKTNIAFSDDSLLIGTLTLPNTLRSIDSYAFEEQYLLQGDLTIACPQLNSIGNYCFKNSFGGGNALLIITNTDLTIGENCFEGSSFNPIIIRKMTEQEIVTYSI